MSKILRLNNFLIELFQVSIKDEVGMLRQALIMLWFTDW